MELQQLRYFKTVAETGHLTRAAEQLYITQPALSHVMRRLEQELGLKLFQKKGRGIELTEYGEHFYQHVRRIFDELEQDRQERQDLMSEDTMPVRIGSTVSGITMPLLISLNAEASDLRLYHTMADNNSELLEKLLDERLDVGFSDVQLFPAGLNHREIWKDRLIALVPKKNPHSGAEALSFGDLASETLIFSRSEATLWEMIQTLQPERELKNVMKAASMPEALRLCSLGLGIAVTTGFFLEIQIHESMHDGKSLLDFAAPVPLGDVSWQISMVWKARGYYRTQLRTFLAQAEAFYAEQSEQSILQSMIRK